MLYKKTCALLICLVAVTILRAQHTTADLKPDYQAPLPLAGYKLVWHDEFNKEGQPDSTVWRYENGFVRNEELQWYQPENAHCAKGVLLIEGKKEQVMNPKYDSASGDWRRNRRVAAYTSASIQTRGLKQWKYGRFEIRARIDTAEGAWPAIWTLGERGEWPCNGEVDLMEFYRYKAQPTILANVAWGTAQPNTAKWHTVTTPLTHFIIKDKNWVNKFHIWRMDWNKDSINLYLDDELLNTTPLRETINADGSNPFHQPQYLLLNLALGKNGGDPSHSKSPIKYEVDYVRVYQKN